VYIQEHLDDELALERLAVLAHFSPYHFHRIFTGLVGEALKDHIRRLRMERAAFRLIHTADRVTDIALGAGYDSLEAFSRRFRTVFGASPTAFRARHAEAWKLPAPGRVHWGEEVGGDALGAGSGGSDAVELGTLEFPSRTIVFARHVGPYHEAVGIWERLRDTLGAVRSTPFGICYDDPTITPADKLRYDACVEVPDAYTPGAGLGKRAMAGGTFAVYTHAGPYAALAEVYDWLVGTWAPRSGHELRDTPCLEIYRRSILDGTEPDDCLTDILIPVGATSAV